MENYTLSDIAAVSGNEGFGGNSAWWIIILFALIFGWGGNGFGNNGRAMDAINTNYALGTDVATLERKLDGIANGIADSTFALNNSINGGFASAQNTMTQGFAGLNTVMVTQGYENRIATQGVQNTMNSCCCDLRQQIGDVNYNIASQANTIGRSIESGFANTNFAIANSNCATLQAIDKVGDRVIDYLATQEAQKLRDENSALRLAASQTAQNNYLVSALRPSPIPSYQVANPYATYNGCCGCNIQ